jgi:hypothetical protein
MGICQFYGQSTVVQEINGGYNRGIGDRIVNGLPTVGVIEGRAAVDNAGG